MNTRKCAVKKNYQEYDYANEEDNQQQMLQFKKINKRKRNKKSQTKNIVLNYRTVIKRILYEQLALETVSSSRKKDITQLMRFMDQYTNIWMLRQCLKLQWFRQILIQNHENGKLLRYIFQSAMFIQNKLYCIKFFNKLLSGIQNPEQFIRWKPLLCQKNNSHPNKKKQINQDETEQSSPWIENLKKENLIHESNEWKMEIQKYDEPLFLRLYSNDPDIKFKF